MGNEKSATVVVPTAGVQGNITSCTLADQVLRVRRESVLSLTEVETHVTYDVCSKQIIAQYDLPSITGVAWGLGLVVAMFVMLVLGMLFAPTPDLPPMMRL